MNIHKNTLYVLVAKKEDLNYFISFNQIPSFSNKSILNIDKFINDFGVSAENSEVKNSFALILESRLKHKLTTIYFISEESVKENDILKLLMLSKKHQMNFEVLYINQDISLNKRLKPLHISLNDLCSARVQDSIALPDRLDVIGDVHGCYDELLELIKRLGYTNKNGKFEHPNNRKMLFLGDLVDKGPKSIEVLLLVFNLCTKQGHYCLKGNHEDYLLQNISKYTSKEQLVGSELSKKTVREIINLEKKQRDGLVQFLSSMPSYYLKEYENKNRFLLCHANIHNFNLEMLDSDFTHGTKLGSDLMYQSNYDLKLNDATLIRGHATQKKAFKNVYSLEDNQVSKGNLLALRLDSFSKSVSLNNFEDSLVKIKINKSYKNK